ncbi:MAG: putative small secreted protein [Bradyrhizobium sp.]|jgi:predicted small secreted protein
MHTSSKTIALILVIASFMLSGCNTINGMGKDVERVGEKVQGASR